MTSAPTPEPSVAATPTSSILSSEWVAVPVLAAATLVACWPMSVFRTVANNMDTSFTVLALDRLQDALLRGGDWRSLGFAWPLPDSVTQVDWMLGEALLGLPLRALGIDPLLAHSASSLLALFTTAWACHRVATLLLGPGPHTWLAGVVGGLNPVHLRHVQHVNLVHHEVVVGAALLLGAGLSRGRPRLAALGGFCAIGAAHFGAYLGAQGAMVATCVALAAATARVGTARAWAAAAGGAIAAGLTLLPVATTYVRVAERFETWFDQDALTAESWDLAQTFSPLFGAPLHGWLTGGEAAILLDPPNPGYLVLALGVLGVATFRSPPGLVWAGRAVAAAGIGAALLALGPDLVWDGQRTGIPGPYRLLAALPGMSGIRSPARWLAVAFCALSLPVAAGARHLATLAAARVGRWAGPAAVLALLGVAVLELPATQARTRLQEVVLEDVYAQLDALPVGGALYDEALVRRDLPPGCDVHVALRAALFHGRPLVGGFFARKFQEVETLSSLASTWPSAQAQELFAAVGVVAVVEHQPAAGSPPDGWSCAWAGNHRLCRDVRAARPPLLTTRSVGVDVNGPVLGLRWTQADAIGDEVTVACGKARRRVPTAPWRALSALRWDLGRDVAAPLDVFFDAPCAGRVGADPAGGIPLYAAAGRDPEPLAELPVANGRRVADSFGSGFSAR